MLVFGGLKPRKFQITEIKNNAKDDATGVVYIPGVCFGAIMPKHAFSGYIHATWVSLCSFISNSHPRTTNHERVKVQIPTFFVCGCRITDW
jgi:hypothetical protein